MHLLSDFETNWCKRYFIDFIEKHPHCHEALFGLSQIYFALELFDKSIELLDRAISEVPNDNQYLLCKAVIQFIYFWLISHDQVEWWKSVYLQAQESALLILKKDS